MSQAVDNVIKKYKKIEKIINKYGLIDRYGHEGKFEMILSKAQGMIEILEDELKMIDFYLLHKWMLENKYMKENSIFEKEFNYFKNGKKEEIQADLNKLKEILK